MDFCAIYDLDGEVQKKNYREWMKESAELMMFLRVF